jgi:hypothetical protein
MRKKKRRRKGRAEEGRREGGNLISFFSFRRSIAEEHQT